MQGIEQLPVVPQSLGAILGLFLSVVAVAGVLIGWGKFLQKLNSFGVRVARVEKANERLDASHSDLLRLGERIMTQHEQLSKDVARAEKTAENCTELMHDMMTNVTGLLQEMRREIADARSVMSERLAAVETELRLARKGRGD